MPLFVTCANESIADGRRKETCRHALTRASQIAPLLEKLDGKTRSELVFEGRDGTAMTVGGGDRRRYVVSIAVNVDEVFFELQRPDAGARGEAVPLIAGGELGVYDSRCVVDLATAIQAALAFAQSGQPDPALRWKTS